MNKRKFNIDWSQTMTKINEATNKTANNFKDERIYQPQFNDNGTAQAIIRFLPSKDTDIPFVSVYSHSIKGPGGWFIENCLTSIKQPCPVCTANSVIWDSDPDLARSRKRKQSYFSNILIVKDPANPENEGKVFIYKYGKKVHDKIMEQLQPGENSVSEPVMVFDYYDGANFRLIIKKIAVGKIPMPNYDSCQFDGPSPVGTDEEISKIDASLYPLSEFISEKNFKAYSELESKFNRVTGSSSPVQTETQSDVPLTVTPTKAATKSPKASTKVAEETVFSGTDDNFFKEIQTE